MAIKIQNDTVIFDDKTFKVASGTTAQRPASAEAGMLRYNTDLVSFEGYSNSSWSPVGSSVVPTITGANSFNELTTNAYVITNYSSFNTYSVSVSHGTASIIGNTITVIAPSITNNVNATLTITVNGAAYNYPITIYNRGETVYTTPGTYSWVCPADVTSISVVCVGAGGSGGGRGLGAGGGALAYRNNVTVTPGTSYTVVVGAAPTSLSSYSAVSVAGGNSSAFSCVAGGGGGATKPAAAAGGTPSGTYDGGGSGGAGGFVASTGTVASGGGGAGGYSGSGGSGAPASNAAGWTAGSGGGGAGGTYDGVSGGGVGLFGIGTSGTVVGQGGSGGTNGLSNTSVANYTRTGGLYGGGGSGNTNDNRGLVGSHGAVRIIYQGDRTFPNNAA